MAKSRIGQWSSRWLFVFAATASAVGLGNVWKFPYITGENGGGIFVLMYVGLIIAIGIPVLMAEIMLGRRGGQNPVDSVEIVALESKLPKAWGWVGLIGIISAFFLLSIYSVIAGWAASYVVRAFSGAFNGLSAQDVVLMYDNFLASPSQVLLWHTVFMGVTAIIVSRGLQNGVEKTVQVLVPGLFIILLVLVGYSITTPGFKEGMTFLFKPDFTKITGSAFLLALGQAFFSLSIGTASMLIYGAYLAKNASIVKAAGSVAILDTLSALLAGIAIFPIVYTYGLEPTQGPGLVFKTLPLAFGEMPFGEMFGGLFFLLLVFAALGSSISMVEPIVAWVTQRWKITRIWATWLSSGLIWLVGLGAVLSLNVWQDYRLFGRWNYYELLDNFVFLLLLPLSGFVLALFAGWYMKREYSFAELKLPEKLYKLWQFSIRYLALVSVIVIALINFI